VRGEPMRALLDACPRLRSLEAESADLRCLGIRDGAELSSLLRQHSDRSSSSVRWVKVFGRWRDDDDDERAAAVHSDVRQRFESMRARWGGAAGGDDAALYFFSG
jgi:hypothetical protein